MNISADVAEILRYMDDLLNKSTAWGLSQRFARLKNFNRLYLRKDSFFSFYAGLCSKTDKNAVEFYRRLEFSLDKLLAAGASSQELKAALFELATFELIYCNYIDEWEEANRISH